MFLGSLRQSLTNFTVIQKGRIIRIEHSTNEVNFLQQKKNESKYENTSQSMKSCNCTQIFLEGIFLFESDIQKHLLV